jgi:hypothetical protein
MRLPDSMALTTLYLNYDALSEVSIEDPKMGLFRKNGV